jgi:7-keto-8-aminopelargonate synthetase-like enzyme
LLRARLDDHTRRLTRGLADLGLELIGGVTPVVSVFIGDEADTLNAGKFLFNQGYYVRPILFPAVPYHGGLLRIQCNANHEASAIDGLIKAFAALIRTLPLFGRSAPSWSPSALVSSLPGTGARH